MIFFPNTYTLCFLLAIIICISFLVFLKLFRLTSLVVPMCQVKRHKGDDEIILKNSVTFYPGLRQTQEHSQF